MLRGKFGTFMRARETDSTNDLISYGKDVLVRLKDPENRFVCLIIVPIESLNKLSFIICRKSSRWSNIPNFKAANASLCGHTCSRLY